MTDRFDLSRRKLLGAVGTIGGAAALGGAGTMAFFSDTEEFANNQLTAGELDMKVAYSEHYSDWKAQDGTPEDDGIAEGDIEMWDGPANTTGTAADLNDGWIGLPTNDAWLIQVASEADAEQFLENTNTAGVGAGDTGDAGCEGNDAEDLPQPVIELGDVKPGDFGEVTFDFTLCDNPGFVWAQGEILDAAENGYTEPELADDDESGEPGDDPAADDEIELLDVVQAAIWVDDGDNYQDRPTVDDVDSGSTTEPWEVSGSLGQVLTTISGEGIPLNGDIPAEDGGGMGPNCFSGETEHSVAFAWWVPVDHGNEIQGDSVTFDLGFYTEQCRHNDPVTNIQSLVDETPAGGTLSLDAGVYRGSLTIDKPITIEGPTAGTHGKEASSGGDPLAIIYPSVNDPNGIVLDVQSDGVVLDGVVIDGDSPELTGGMEQNGAHLNAGYGVLNTVRDGVEMTVRNCIFRNLRFGQYFWGPDSGSVDGTVERCLFDNTDRGVIPIYNAYVDVLDNCMRDVRIGIQTNTYFNADTNGSGGLIADNDIQSSRLGIWHNLHFSNASAFTIEDNLLAPTTGSDLNWGIFVASLQSGVDAVVRDNDVNDSQYGVAAWNLPTSAEVAVEGGSLADNEVGVIAFEDYFDYNGDSRADGSPFELTLDGINVSGSADVDVLATEDTGYEGFSSDDGSGLSDRGDPEVEVTLQNMGGVSTRAENGATID